MCCDPGNPIGAKIINYCNYPGLFCWPVRVNAPGCAPRGQAEDPSTALTGGSRQQSLCHPQVLSTTNLSLANQSCQAKKPKRSISSQGRNIREIFLSWGGNVSSHWHVLPFPSKFIKVLKPRCKGKCGIPLLLPYGYFSIRNCPFLPAVQQCEESWHPEHLVNVNTILKALLLPEPQQDLNTFHLLSAFVLRWLLVLFPPVTL